MDDQLHDAMTPPMANPSLDMDDDDNQVSAAMIDGGEGANEDNQLTEHSLAALNGSIDPSLLTNGLDAPVRDLDAISNASSSELSELDEAQFAGVDESAVNITRAPMDLDEDALNTIKVGKKKRIEGDNREDGEERARRKKGLQRRKERRRRPEVVQDDEMDMLADNEQLDRGARRKQRKERVDEVQESAAEKRERIRKEKEELEALLTPDERARREREAYIDAALRGAARKGQRKRPTGLDAEDSANQQIENLRNAMIAASAEDSKLHAQGRLAANKIRYLETIKQTFNNASLRAVILDPEINFLEAVKFFIEPLSSSTLPGYTIQSTIWTLLEKFPMTVDALLSSGLGNLAVFYTKSIQPDRAITLKAQRCVEEWARVILNRGDDVAPAEDVSLQTRVYDPELETRRLARSRQRQQLAQSGAGGALAQERNKYGSQENNMQSVREAMRPNRAVIPEREFKTYSVVPKSLAVGREKTKRGAGDGDRGVLGKIGKR